LVFVFLLLLQYWVLTQGLMLARQALYHSNHASSRRNVFSNRIIANLIMIAIFSLNSRMRSLGCLGPGLLLLPFSGISTEAPGSVESGDYTCFQSCGLRIQSHRPRAQRPPY
jgi:hypothetical protein